MKLLTTLLFFSIFLNYCWSYQVIRELRKQINDGEILGRYMTSETGRTVKAFIGIPFASPPIDDLRFRAPQKVTPWNGTLITQYQRPKCPQIDTMVGSTVVEGDEDCLYVNVYVPEKIARTNNRLDVIVWIHGGVKFLEETTKCSCCLILNLPGIYFRSQLSIYLLARIFARA